jgi:tyrosine-protein kinase Etk/Wzc
MATEAYVPATRMPITASASLLTWMRVAIRWKKLILCITIAVVALGSAVALLLPNLYTATVVILPPQQGSSAGAAMMAQLGSMGGMAAAACGLGIKNPNDQQVALLKSRIVEDAMVARFHLEDLYHKKYLSTTRKRWEKSTTTDNGLKDGMIRISVTDRDPRRAAELANGWVEEYRRFTATLAISEASQRRLFYERQLTAAHDDLTHAEEDMKQTQQRTGIIDVEGQDRGMIAAAAVLRGQLAAKQIEIRAMREFAADGNPDLQRSQQEAVGMEGQLAALDAANDRKTGDLIAPKGTATQAGLDYARAMREVKYRETIVDLLTRQYEGARVDEARQGALVQIVEPAVAPDRPSSQYRIWILLGALICSLPLALMTAVGAEIIAILRRSRRRSGSWYAALELAITETWQS